MRLKQIVILLILIGHGFSSLVNANGELHVVAVAPHGAELDLSEQIMIEFSQPMVAVGGNMSDANVTKISIKPSLPCRWRWLSQNQLACELPKKGGMRLATEYVVAIDSGFTNKSIELSVNIMI